MWYLSKKLTGFIAAMAVVCTTHSQELFVFTEPASNMPAHSIGLRLTNWLMDETETGDINYHAVPEIMWGVNKRLMMHVEGYFSNRTTSLTAEGAGLYAKYRFYSNDQVNRHFRMAAFARISSNNGAIHQEEIETNGHNTGYELGWIGTQLLHKFAFNGSISYEHALDNQEGHELPANASGNAINYTFSIGKLVLPHNYTGYGQTNLNLMAEFLGQSLPDNGGYFLDFAPSVQLIFNSQTRLDIGYKQQITNNMQRTAPNGLVIRIEHLLFNAL